MARQKIEEVESVKSLINKLQLLAGKKVSLRESRLNESSNIKTIMLLVRNIKNILERNKYKFMEYEHENIFKTIMINLNDIEACCGEESLTEDVDMDIDQITNEPDVVKKLNDKKININLVDKNNRNASSSLTTSSSTTY